MRRYIAGLIAVGGLLLSPLLSYWSFILGLAGAWSFLNLTTQTIRFPTLYWERLSEFRIRLWLFFLAICHAIPAVLVGLALEGYLGLFLVIAAIHIGAEIWVIINRPPKGKNGEKPTKKPIKYWKSKKRNDRQGEFRSELGWSG